MTKANNPHQLTIKEIEKSLKDLRDCAMSILLKQTKHKRFFTQEEYESNKGIIMMINGDYDKAKSEVEKLPF